VKRILLFGIVCLPLISSLAGETDGRLAVEEVVSRALAANPMLKASVAKWVAMNERVPQAKAWDGPMVGVDFERLVHKKSVPCAPFLEPAPSKNILFIVADDLNCIPSCYGGGAIAPNIDWLGNR
jgi:hypothetical protein